MHQWVPPRIPQAMGSGWWVKTAVKPASMGRACSNVSLRQCTDHNSGDDWSFAAFLTASLVELLPLACHGVASGLACKERGGPTWDRTRDQSVMSRLL